jgi:benzoyl-CoA reductase/2-hydroxyglutaryl-CoA dehydratase subunit BcrC/BadD/HgdB
MAFLPRGRDAQNMMAEMNSYRKIQASGVLRKIMADHFYALDRASRAGWPKVAWCTSMGPAELLLSLGFMVYYPENHGAMLGASRTANDYIPAANAMGYSPDICSYLTSDIGAYLKKRTPLAEAYEGIEAVPRPDVLVVNTQQCRDVQEWFSWYSRELRVPMFGLSGTRNLGEISEDLISGIVRQLKDLVPPLERISGTAFDIDRLRDVVALSRQCTRLWRQIFDAVVHMGPAVILRGSEAAVSYYQVLLREMQDRIARREGAVSGEQFRLYWEGMPIWGRLKDLAEFFIAQKTAVVASTYGHSWVFEGLDPSDPFLSLARATAGLFITRDEAFKEKYIEEMVHTYQADAVLFHDAKTCPNNSNSRYGLPERIRKRLNIPTLTINGDLNDLRCYSDEQTKTAIEAFLEHLRERPSFSPGRRELR